jgi:hypothetical protein
MKSFRKIAVAAVLALATALTSFGAVPVQAAARENVWQQTTAGTYDFSDGANWSLGALQTGDVIVFSSCDNGGADQSVTMTLNANSDLTLGGVKVNYDHSSYCSDTRLSYKVSGTIKLSGGSELDVSYFYPDNVDSLVYDVVSAGGLKISSHGGGIMKFSSAGTLIVVGYVGTNSLTGNIDNIVIDETGRLGINSDTAIPITVVENWKGNSNMMVNSPIEVISAYSDDCTGMCEEIAVTRTISGPITLHGNADVLVGYLVTARFTGTISGGILSKSPDSNGQLILGNEIVEIPETNTPLDGDNDDSVTVHNKETATLNGTRGSINVQSGGLLKGVGKVNGFLLVYENGTISPGNSAGKITAGCLTENGTYIAELKDKGSYDQLVVAGTCDTYANNQSYNVILGANSILDLRLLEKYDIKTGDTFTIIDNQGSKAVSGTFKGLAEGSTIKVGDIEFKISYVGGDGNDVVLTARNGGNAADGGAAVGAPNTGMLGIILGNPLVVLASGLVVAGLVMKLWRNPAKQR